MNTYKKSQSTAFCYDLHFWLGSKTSQDESGTAAYKAVELDDFLGGAPIQYRQVDGFETELFNSYFPKGMIVQEGGIESGFNHVKPEEYRARLLHVRKQGRSVLVREVPIERASLNLGDVFILDLGLKLFQWTGSNCQPNEKMKAAEIVSNIRSDRNGKPQLIQVEAQEQNDEFWSHLGGFGEVANDFTQVLPVHENALFKLTDQTGKLEFSKVSSGKLLREHLDSKDAFVLDSGNQAYVWVGKSASKDEKRFAIQYAQDYLCKNSRPTNIPISRIIEGGETESFNKCFNQ